MKSIRLNLAKTSMRTVFVQQHGHKKLHTGYSYKSSDRILVPFYFLFLSGNGDVGIGYPSKTQDCSLFPQKVMSAP